MAEVRYSVPGVPAAVAAGLNAFTPHFNRYAASGAQSYKYAVTGRPGTEAIPMTAQQDSQISPDRGDLAQMGYARSSDAPDVIYPNQYYQRFIAEPPGAGMPIIRITNEATGQRDVLPVPAVDVAAALRGQQAMSPPTGIVQRVRQLPWFPRLYQAPPA